MAGRFVELVRSLLPGREIAEQLEPVLAERAAHARAIWPKLALGEDALIQAIAQRLAIELSAESALDALHISDLYLACGCAAGDPAALAGFEQQCGAMIDRALAAAGASPAERADLGQIVRQRLLVERVDGGPPRIARYSARGSLVAWVRVVTAREAARLLPRAHREIAVENEELAGIIAEESDPEIGYLKRLYREEFSRAFHAAVEALEDRERLLLRQHVLDGLGIDQLAALHRVHRATAARWVQAARDAVAAGTQRDLSRRLGLSRAELVSVMRLIWSRLDVSLSRALADRA